MTTSLVARGDLRRTMSGFACVAEDLERLKRGMDTVKAGLAAPSTYAGVLGSGLGRLMLCAHSLTSDLSCVAEDLGRERKVDRGSLKAALAALAADLSGLRAKVAALESDVKWVKATIEKHDLSFAAVDKELDAIQGSLDGAEKTLEEMGGLIRQACEGLDEHLRQPHNLVT